MDPLSITGTLIAVLQITTSVISILYDYRSGVASASREVIQITEALNSLKDVLESILRLIETTKANELSTIGLLEKSGGTLQSCQAELERLRVKLVPEKGWRKARNSLIWPLKESEMRRALEGLERWKSTMQLALSADQASLSLSIKGDVEDLTQMFQRYSTDLKRQAIYKWLAAPDPYTNHVTNRKKRQPQTGIWLLRSKQYEHWLQSQKSFLWIYGIREFS
ncbi:hypothetical protein N431DRAFT_109437 [Stipitochalara longipes BDJ]|nr:hypothetical protein N431DRAFT_109437 [Stipitochalara longipes BDJ]